jgi:hypothetical protein
MDGRDTRCLSASLTHGREMRRISLPVPEDGEKGGFLAALVNKQRILSRAVIVIVTRRGTKPPPSCTSVTYKSSHKGRPIEIGNLLSLSVSASPHHD